MRGITRYREIEPWAGGLLAALLYVALICCALQCGGCVHYTRLDPVARPMGHQFETAVRVETLCIDHDPFTDDEMPGIQGGNGSGVVIDARHALTAYHVVGDCPYISDVHVELADGRRLRMRVDKEWRDLDIVRLVLASADTFGDVPPPPLDNPARSEGVCAATSWPDRAGTCGQVERTFVSECFDTGPRHWCRDFAMTLTIAGGNSGGPLYDAMGSLVGLVTGGQFDGVTHEPTGTAYGHSLPADVMP